MLSQKAFNQYVNENQKKECYCHNPSRVASFRWNLHHGLLRLRLVDGVCDVLKHCVVNESVAPAGAPAGHIDRVAAFPDIYAVVDIHRVGRARFPHRRFSPRLTSFLHSRRPTASATRQAQDNRHYEGSC